MDPSFRSFTPAQASAALGVSAKALRLYEQHGLLVPGRTRTGWRAYDAGAMARAAEIVAFRNLGLSLAQIARVLDGKPHDLDVGLAAHEARLNEQGRQLASALERVRLLRADLAQGRAPTPRGLEQVVAQSAPLTIGFALPWPWDGEWFSLHDVPRLAFITGPLGSGKTRFAQRLATALPDAGFLGLDRLSDPAVAQRLADDAALAERVECRLVWLTDDGAERSDALTALVVALESPTPAIVVIDMVEEAERSNPDGADGAASPSRNEQAHIDPHDALIDDPWSRRDRADRRRHPMSGQPQCASLCRAVSGREGL